MMALPSSGSRMEAKIWSNLPDEVVERILARLPAESFLCLRCVCKRWNALLSSPSFVSLCCKISHRPWLVMFRRRDHRICRAYDIFISKWHNISLCFLPYQTAEVVAASGGLLCLRTPFSLSVCNPLTKTWREFPFYSHEHNWCAIALVAEEGPKGYKIVVAGSSLDRRTEAYDSITDSWKRTEDLPLRTNLRYEATYCDGVLYFTTSDHFVIMGYNLQRGSWSRVEAPMPESLICNRLVSCGNRLYIVGGVGHNGISRSIWVWELSQDGREWREVQKLPEMMCKKFLAICYHNYEHISCVGHEDYICLSCFTSPEVLVYKLSRRTWHWLPRCPYIPDEASYGFKWFSFIPSLYALV
uniref:F-box domain-containing protein n=1 Tax=Araucaria cunninghamii TaxID=56994 RepID=A0A0D6R1K7_ARACU